MWHSKTQSKYPPPKFSCFNTQYHSNQTSSNPTNLASEPSRATKSRHPLPNPLHTQSTHVPSDALRRTQTKHSLSKNSCPSNTQTQSTRNQIFEPSEPNSNHHGVCSSNNGMRQQLDPKAIHESFDPLRIATLRRRVMPQNYDHLRRDEHDSHFREDNDNENREDNDNENQFNEDELENDQLATNTDSGKKNGRGPTRMHKIWARRDGDLLKLNFNEFEQPIGDDASNFTNFLGTVVKNGNDVSLAYKDWRQVPLEDKDKLWAMVKLKYVIGEDSRPWVMKALGKKWKDFKCELKKKHYNTHDTDDERFADRDPRVLPDQWKRLIDFWNSEEGQAGSSRSKINRSKQVITHTAGSKSFARIREEERKNKGVVPTRAELFKITHVHKDGKNEECHKKIEKFSEVIVKNPDIANKDIKEGDLYAEVFGKERHGYVRGLGFGPCPTDIWSSKPSRAACIRMASEAKRKAEEETREMKGTIVDLQAQIAEMKEMIAALQRNPTGFHQSNSMEARQNVANITTPADGLERDTQSSSSSHAIPSHLQRVRKKLRVQHKHQNEGGKEVILMSLGKPHRPVARGILFGTDPSTIVGGERLGQEFWEVYIEVVIMAKESLIQSFRGLKTIGDAVKQSIAWPSFLVIEA